MPFGKDVGIVPFAAVELVIAGTAGQDIVAGIAVEFIIARTAIQDIVAGIAVEFVVACTAVQYVVLTIAVQDIVTGMTIQFVSAGPAGNGFLGLRTLQSQTVLHQSVQCNGFIGELERDVSTSRIQEIIGNPNGIAAVIAEQDQIVSVLAETHFIGFDIGEPESLCTLIVRHKVRTVPFGKDVGIVPFVAVELVIAGTADQDIITFPA